VAGLKRNAKVNSARRQPNDTNAPSEPSISTSSAWRRLLIVACEDVGIGALDTVVIAAARSANTKALREMGRDEAAALATAQMLAEAPKDRSADLLFAVTLHDPALENIRSRCRSISVARRLEFVVDPKLPLPKRALAV
jgi:MgsA AAA+ ATPase C terminal